MYIKSYFNIILFWKLSHVKSPTMPTKWDEKLLPESERNSKDRDMSIRIHHEKCLHNISYRTMASEERCGSHWMAASLNFETETRTIICDKKLSSNKYKCLQWHRIEIQPTHRTLTCLFQKLSFIMTIM